MVINTPNQADELEGEGVGGGNREKKAKKKSLRYFELMAP